MKSGIGFLVLLFSLNAQADDSAFKKTKLLVANMGPGCNVRLNIPVKAEFPVTYSKDSGRGGAGLTLENPFSLNNAEHYIYPFYFGFICYASDEGIVDAAEVQFDTQRQEWVLDVDKRIASMGTTWSEEQMAEWHRVFPLVIKVYQLNTINANGYAITEDEMIGDEEFRQRHLSYCLIHGPKALCGHGAMGYLEAGEEGDLTPYALQILRSIEFIDDAPETLTPSDVSQ